MKKLTRIVVALLCTIGMTGVLSSCENDAPEINAQWTYITDWSKLVEAINNQSARMTIAIEGLGDNLTAKLDANGRLIMNAIDQNGQTVSSAITSGFSGTNQILGTMGDNIVAGINANTAAIIRFDENTQRSFTNLMNTITQENAKLILAIGNVEGQVRAVALAVDQNGNVIKAAISDAATLLNNTLLAQNTLLSTKADEMKTEIINLSDANSSAISALKDQMQSSLASVETATTTGFTNLTTKTETGMEALGNKLSEINGSITLGAANITAQMVTSTSSINGTLQDGFSGIKSQLNTSLDAIVTIIQTKGNAIADAIDRNTTATTTAGTDIKAAISTFDTNTQAKLKALAKQLKASGEEIQSVLTTLLDENSALVTVINEKGETIAQGIVDVKTELAALNQNITNMNQILSEKSDLIIAAIDDNTKAIGKLDKNLRKSLGNMQEEIATQGGAIVGGIATMSQELNGSIFNLQEALVAEISANGVIMQQIADNVATMDKNLSKKLQRISNNIASFSEVFDFYADGIVTKLGLIDGSIQTMDENQQAGAELIAEAIYDLSIANGEKMDSLFTVINTQGGELVAAIDYNGELIVDAIDDNGTAISNAITVQGEAIVAEITNLKKAVKNQLEGINTTLQTTNDKLDLTNGNLSNIQSAIVNNAQALTNIFNAVDDINDNLEDIAGALGAIDTEELVEAIGAIATNTGDQGAIAQAILTISTSQTRANTFLKNIATAIGTGNANLADIKDALDELQTLGDIYTAITDANAKVQLANLEVQLDKIVKKLEQIRQTI